MMTQQMIFEDLKIDVVRQKGSRSVKLAMNRKTGRPELRLPYLYPLMLARPFVAKHLVWIRKHIELTPDKKTFQIGDSFNLLGKEVRICETTRGTYLDGDMLYVARNSANVHRRVINFIKKYFEDYACQKAISLAGQNGKKVVKVSCRDTVSRWGSCSSSAHLSFSWRLAFAPQFVADYVIAHEVAHLFEMNHSKAFWDKVGQMNPDAKKAKKWLSENAAQLHAIL